ncbi:unnamed protein product [Peniophora sp. CBMAI 1063]|nr:unnamed protein product [Peniophora sp. CBMAI 1063]
MDSFLRHNQLLQQNAHARQAGGEPQGFAATAASSAVVNYDDIRAFWGGEGFPTQGKPVEEVGVGRGTEKGVKREERFTPWREDSATSPRTARYLSLTDDLTGLRAGMELDPLVVPYTPQNSARQLGSFGEPAQLPVFHVEYQDNALGFYPDGTANYNGLQTPLTQETAALHDFGTTPAALGMFDDFGTGLYTPCGSTTAQSFYGTPANGNHGDFDQLVVPPEWYYGAQVSSDMSSAPYAANGYHQQANSGFSYVAPNGSGNFTHQAQAAALPPAGYGVWQQGMGSFAPEQALTSYSVVRAPTPLHLAGFPYDTAPNPVASGSRAPTEAQQRTQVSSAHPQTQDFPAASGSRTQARAVAEPQQKVTAKPRKAVKKATGKVKSSSSKVTTGIRPPPHSLPRFGSRASLKKLVTLVPFAERLTTTVPNAVVSYYDARKANYILDKHSTLPPIKCPVDGCNVTFTSLSTCRRHVDHFAGLYVQKRLDDPAHFDVQKDAEFGKGRVHPRDPGMAAVACGYPGCSAIYSRPDAARRHRKICTFKPTDLLPTALPAGDALAAASSRDSGA